MKTNVRAEMLCGSILPRGVIFADAGSSEQVLENLRSQLDALHADTEALIASADAENRDLTDAELAKIEANRVAAEKLGRQVQAREAAVAARPGRRSGAEPENSGGQRRATPTAVRPADAGRFGFKNLGEFALTVKAAGGDAPNQEATARLQNALTTYGNEGTGADGGFLVPPDFRREVAVKIFGEESLLTRTDRMTTSTNSIVIPTDETTPWGTTGVQAYWESEAGQKTQSKPVFGQNSIRLNKLIALVPVTDEMLADGPQIDGYLRRKVPEVMVAKLNTALVFGTGVGQPLGMLAGPALITVTKETSQPADTVWFNNIVSMYSRMAAGSVARSLWLINQSIIPQLLTMRFDATSTVPIPVYMPPTGAAGAPYGTLLGRPILPLEAMKALGDLGDIAFVDPSQYMTVTKGQDIQTDVSIHLFFDYDVTAFRFVFRVAGQPWWKTVITPQSSGAPTLGHFITLEARG